MIKFENILKEYTEFPSAFDIGQDVVFLPMESHCEEFGISKEYGYGNITAVRFTKAKVFYDIVDDYYGFLFSNVDSSYVKIEEYVPLAERIRLRYTNLITELTYQQIRGEAPNFLNIRAKSKKTPGSHYQSTKADGTVIFRTQSHTTPGVTYTQFIRLVDLPELLVKYKDTLKPIEIVRKAIAGNLALHCTDPSWLYWGFQYKGTKEKYAIEPETRAPRIRNPHLLGSVCKHIDASLLSLPFNAALINRDLVKLGLFKKEEEK